MSRIDDHSCLLDLAFLYLCIAHQSGDYLTDSELETVTRKLAERSALQRRERVQPLVMEALDGYVRLTDVDAGAAETIARLGRVLTRGQRETVLADLTSIAMADGVLHRQERIMLDRLAADWGVARETENAAAVREEDWGVLHDIAYLYLVLAHGTDHDLAHTEMQVMLNKLQEWRPDEASEDVRSVFDSATSAYALGPDEERIERAIDSVRRSLPREQRMAALNDLVKIANADGVFLDTEEDLINHLTDAWDVDPYANYEGHGSKA